MQYDVRRNKCLFLKVNFLKMTHLLNNSFLFNDVLFYNIMSELILYIIPFLNDRNTQCT